MGGTERGMPYCQNWSWFWVLRMARLLVMPDGLFKYTICYILWMLLNSNYYYYYYNYYYYYCYYYCYYYWFYDYWCCYCCIGLLTMILVLALYPWYILLTCKWCPVPSPILILWNISTTNCFLSYTSIAIWIIPAIFPSFSSIFTLLCAV